MTTIREKKGPILFGLILVIIVLVSFAAYKVTGPMGIEERYSSAVGLPGGGEESGGNWFGFSLEGNQVLYAGILGALIIVCFAAYRYGK